ncbi:MAG: MotA/TolQ/ExbB proton channel family protein [Akkermansiaceae bacterium]
MKFPLISLGILISSLLSLAAQDMSSIRKDLDKAQQRLTEQRQNIAVEKPLIAGKFEETRAQLLEKRRKARLARMAVADRDALLADLKTQQVLAEQDHQYTMGLMRDYGLRLETFLLPGESEINGLRAAITDPADDPAAELKARMQVLEAGVSRLENLLGGSVVQGEAVASDGEVKNGRFALAGPLIFFASEDASLIGSVTREKGSLSPRVIAADDNKVKALVSGQLVTIGVDASGGKALALASLENDKLDVFRKGGFWIWPILGIALVSAFSGVVKFCQIIKVKTPAPDWVSQILSALREGDKEEAAAISQSIAHPASDVLSRCLEFIKAGPDVVEEVLYEQLLGVQHKLQSWLPFIAITAAIAPLLGLLGTVSGMIRTFNIITVVGTGDAKPLAGGISEALLTTLFGLVVAIPALIIHSLLSRRCQGIAQTTEKLGLTLVNGLRGEVFKNKDV